MKVSAGAGGTEARDWTGILLRMLTGWCDRTPGIDCEVTSTSGDNGPGFSSAELLVNGHGAYGRLLSEHGVHRLSRVSPWGKVAKRHTSFAAVEVIPTLATAPSAGPSRVRIDTYRGSGSGGQHRNKTDSAVRATCLDTGLVAECSSSRSQHRNKETAMRILAARIADRHEQRAAEATAEIRGPRQAADFGTRSRSYVLSPYSMVTDHRSGHKTASADRVLTGNLDDLMAAWAQWRISQ